MIGVLDHLRSLRANHGRLCCVHLAHPLLKLAVGGVQRGATVDAQDLRGLLELLLAVVLILHVFVVVFIILVAAPGRSIFLPLLGLAAVPSPAVEWPLLAWFSTTTLGLLLVVPFVLSFLLLDEVLDAFAVGEVVALGAVDLAVWLVGAVLLVGCRHRGRLLAGAASLCLLGGSLLAGLLDGKHFLLALSPVIPPPALLCRGGVIAVASSCASVLPGEFPPFFCACALISQSIELADIPNLGHGHFFPHAAVTHVLVERADNRGRVDVGDVALYAAEALDVLAQGFSFLLGQNVEIALLAVGFVAAREGANKLMAKICPRGNGAFRQVHKPRTNVRLKHEREVVRQNLLVAPPGSLHSDRVDAEEFRGVRPAVVLLRYVGLEILRAGPLDAPQLTGERRAACRVRQVAWFTGRARVDSVPSSLA